MQRKPCDMLWCRHFIRHNAWQTTIQHSVQVEVRNTACWGSSRGSEKRGQRTAYPPAKGSGEHRKFPLVESGTEPRPPNLHCEHWRRPRSFRTAQLKLQIQAPFCSFFSSFHKLMQRRGVRRLSVRLSVHILHKSLPLRDKWLDCDQTCTQWSSPGERASTVCTVKSPILVGSRQIA